MAHLERNIFFLMLGFSIVFVLLVNSVQAEAQEGGLNEIYELELSTKISVPVTFRSEGEPSSLEYLLINYSWIPKNDYRQELISYTSNPKGAMSDDNLLIDIKEKNNFILNVDFTTHTNAAPIEVTRKVSFPIKGLDPRISKYMLPTEKIDINDDIRKKATELAANEDDLYVVVFNIADWVNSNIEYNLSTATVDASLPASWVFENQYGVCDEISNLFISMCRSIGIPARFVSGIAYTDDTRFENEWGAHGWAEVYFPGYGWIPFDPTYDQLGYVDATHIKFDDNIEGNKNAIQYTWLGHNLEVETGQIKIQGTVVREGNSIQDDFSVDVDFMRDDVDFGSYNVVEAQIRNNQNYYVAAQMAISRTEDITVYGEERRDVLLKPYETMNLYWIVKVGELSKNFIYTFPVTVYSTNEEGTSRFTAKDGSTSMDFRTAENYIQSNEVQLLGPQFECTSSQSSIYQFSPITITCSSNSMVPLKVCVEESCSIERNLTFQRIANLTEIGFSTIKISASEVGDSKYSYSFQSFNVLDEANISLNVNSPKRIKFNEQGVISTAITKESSNKIMNGTLRISSGLMSQKWNAGEIDAEREFILEFYGKHLKNGENLVNIEFEFYDELGKSQSVKKQIEVELYDLTLWQKIYVWMNSKLSAL